ncbi:hypothetical protein D0T56_09650 [Dysgonomonas sp. 520]|nr:hypothetical protein [Dysgonomonas sp. 520]
MFLLAAAMTFSFVACDGGKKTDAAQGGDSAKTEAPATEGTTAASDNAIDKYISLAEQMLPLIEKGDFTSAEYTKLAEEVAKLTPELAKVDPTTLTEEQQKKYTEVAQKMAEAAQKMAGAVK